MSKKTTLSELMRAEQARNNAAITLIDYSNPVACCICGNAPTFKTVSVHRDVYTCDEHLILLALKPEGSK